MLTVWLKNPVHETHECCRCICKYERNYFVFVKSVSGNESGFLTIVKVYPNLVVATSKAQLGKDPSSVKSIKKVVDIW